LRRLAACGTPEGPAARGEPTLPPIDPVTLAVIQNGLVQVCNEMDLAFSRAAFSPVIAEANDRSDGIDARDTGELIAQGELGLPVFVGTMQHSTAAVIEAIRAGRAAPAEEGDVFVLNDPYLGGTHLMVVKFVEPGRDLGQFRARRLGPGAQPRLRHVPHHRRRLRRQRRS
jgi:N-methylhydantoinase B/oxoprolinase/acetone carboxylase alpha subunit